MFCRGPHGALLPKSGYVALSESPLLVVDPRKTFEEPGVDVSFSLKLGVTDYIANNIARADAGQSKSPRSVLSAQATESHPLPDRPAEQYALPPQPMASGDHGYYSSILWRRPIGAASGDSGTETGFVTSETVDDGTGLSMFEVKLQSGESFIISESDVVDPGFRKLQPGVAVELELDADRTAVVTAALAYADPTSDSDAHWLDRRQLYRKQMYAIVEVLCP